MYLAILEVYNADIEIDGLTSRRCQVELDTRDRRRASVGYESLYLFRKARLTLYISRVFWESHAADVLQANCFSRP